MASLFKYAAIASATGLAILSSKLNDRDIKLQQQKQQVSNLEDDFKLQLDQQKERAIQLELELDYHVKQQQLQADQFMINEERLKQQYQDRIQMLENKLKLQLELNQQHQNRITHLELELASERDHQKSITKIQQQQVKNLEKELFINKETLQHQIKQYEEELVIQYQKYQHQKEDLLKSKDEEINELKNQLYQFEKIKQQQPQDAEIKLVDTHSNCENVIEKLVEESLSTQIIEESYSISSSPQDFNSSKLDMNLKEEKKELSNVTCTNTITLINISPMKYFLKKGIVNIIPILGHFSTKFGDCQVLRNGKSNYKIIKKNTFSISLVFDFIGDASKAILAGKIQSINIGGKSLAFYVQENPAYFEVDDYSTKSNFSSK